MSITDQRIRDCLERNFINAFSLKEIFVSKGKERYYVVPGWILYMMDAKR